MQKFVISILNLLLLLSLNRNFSRAAQAKTWPDEEETPEFWQNLGKEELLKALNLQKLNMNVARNVILLLGDGMGVPTITAGRILKGQLNGNPGEETVLAMDKFDHVGLSKTYSVDKQVSDSAATATAYLCGVKSKDGTIGFSGRVINQNCSSTKGNEVDSFLVDAFRAGKSTGIVTTTRINHATPAAAYAHSAHRFWYGDADMPQDALENGCKDLAQQFYDSSHMITVALGGGRQHFQPNATTDPEYGTNNERLDGQDLIAQWLQTNQLNRLDAKYVWNKTEFDNVDPISTDRLLGLFENDDMQFEADRARDPAGEPSLAEMTGKAIQMLQKNSKGYFLLVEGGRIDHGHHGTNAYRALHDLVAFDDAVAKAVQMTSDSDTLIIVTADHSHTFNFGGYTDRGNPIFGTAIREGEVAYGLDSKPYTALLYGNGPGFQGPNTASSESDPHTRQNLTFIDTEHHLYRQQTAVPLQLETHAGEDVTIMARGPMAHLFHGVHEQSYIAYVMRYASCLSTDTGHCEGGSMVPTFSSPPPVSSVAKFLGMDLNGTEVEVALNVQFALLIVLFVFSIAMVGLVITKRKGGLSVQYDKDAAL